MVYENDEPIKEFDESELRFGVVWRDVCLPPGMHDHWIANRDTLNANDAVDALVEKLKMENVEIPDDKIELAQLILKRFVRYPIGDGIIPYNYCMLPQIVPTYAKLAVTSILKPICAQTYSNSR